MDHGVWVVTPASAGSSHVDDKALQLHATSRLPWGAFGSSPPGRPLEHEGGTYARCESATHPGPGNSTIAVGPRRLFRRRSSQGRQLSGPDGSSPGEKS